LHGVDAFIYGGVTRRADGTYLASLKMMNVYNGVIEWADLIRMEDAPAPRGDGSAGGTGAQGMVSIPAGLFLMGTNDGPRHAAPLHQVNLPAYRIDEGEVSNAEYQKFVLARNYRAPVGWVGTSYPEGAGDLPVVGVNWVDARRYCEFAGKRLPSEQEWEKAARGPGGQKYPWQGNTFSPSFTVTRESGRKLPLAVNEPTRDVSPYGVKHLAGNVREWVEDTFAAYQANARISDPRFGRERVVRGASWATDYHSAPAYFRGASNPSLAWQDLGFRCASSP
jgi:iron(II)-dependent oxidoreductase